MRWCSSCSSGSMSLMPRGRDRSMVVADSLLALLLLQRCEFGQHGRELYLRARAHKEPVIVLGQDTDGLRHPLGLGTGNRFAGEPEEVGIGHPVDPRELDELDP